MKRVSLVAFIALAFLIWIIWRDPSGAADTVRSFASSAGDFFASVWHKLGEFFGNLSK